MAATCPALALFLTEYSPAVPHTGDGDPAPSSPTNSDEPAVPPAGSILLVKAALWELTRDSTALAATKMPEVHVEVVNDRRRIRLKSEESDNELETRGEMLGEGHASFYNFKAAMSKVSAETFIAEITNSHPEIHGLNAELIIKVHIAIREQNCPCNEEMIPGRHLLLLQMVHKLAQPMMSKCKFGALVLNTLQFIANLGSFGLRANQVASEHADCKKVMAYWSLLCAWIDLENENHDWDGFQGKRKERRALKKKLSEAIKCDDAVELQNLARETFTIYMNQNPNRCVNLRLQRSSMIQMILIAIDDLSAAGPLSSSS